MPRSQMRHNVKDAAGNVIQNALCYVYLTGTTTAVSDMYAAASGGATITTLTSNAQGDIEGWFDAAQTVDIKVTDNSDAAYYPSQPTALLSWSDFTETVQIGGSGGAVETLVTVADAGAAETIDVSAGTVYDLTLTAATCVITLTGAEAGTPASVTVILREDATGSRLVTWPSSVRWSPDRTAPVLTTGANEVDVVTLLTVDGGTRWLGFFSGQGQGDVTYSVPTEVQHVSAAEVTATSIVGTFPATPTEGQLLIACHSAFTSNASITGPSGWTKAVHQDGAASGCASIWFKVAGPGESTTVTFTTATSVIQDLDIFEFGGMVTSSPLDKTQSATGSSVTTLSTGSTAATAQAEELAVAIVAVRGGSSGGFGNTWTNGFTQRGVGTYMTCATKVLSATGAQETTETWTSVRNAMAAIATFKGA